MKWSDRYDSLFQWYGIKYQAPWRMLKAQAFAESGFNPDAHSSAGAMGLMQFMGLTAKDEGVRDPLDPEEAIEGAARYDAKLHSMVALYLHGLLDDPLLLWRWAICSYNCGWGYVRAALEKMRAQGNPLTWEMFTQALPHADFKGKKPDHVQALAYALKVVPDESVLNP